MFASLQSGWNKEQDHKGAGPTAFQWAVPEIQRPSFLELTTQLNWKVETKASVAHLWPCTASSDEILGYIIVRLHEDTAQAKTRTETCILSKLTDGARGKAHTAQH